MSKKIILTILFVVVAQFSFAEKILITPITIQDAYGREIEIEDDITSNIVTNLNSYWFEGLLEFEKIDKSEFGNILTILDVRNLCVIKNVEYSLYGYIQKNETSWFGNIKLYSKTHKKIIKEFFASDNINYYKRFEDTLKNNIAFGLKELIGLESMLKKDDLIEPFTLGISAGIFYWNPIDSKWQNAYVGVAGGQLGTELFLPYERKVSNFFNTSIRFMCSYSFGFGNEKVYPLNLHTFQIDSTLIEAFNFNKTHSVYLGLGPYYEIEILSVVEKYEDEKKYYQNMFGLKSLVGYKITANKYISFSSELAFDLHLSSDLYISIKPTLLVNINIFKGK